MKWPPFYCLDTFAMEWKKEWFHSIPPNWRARKKEVLDEMKFHYNPSFFKQFKQLHLVSFYSTLFHQSFNPNLEPKSSSQVLKLHVVYIFTAYFLPVLVEMCVRPISLFWNCHSHEHLPALLWLQVPLK